MRTKTREGLFSTTEAKLPHLGGGGGLCSDGVVDWVGGLPGEGGEGG